MHVEEKQQKVNNAKKADKKQRRCLAIIKSDCEVSPSDDPTPYLAILNVGLSNGLTEECLLQAAASTGGKVTQVVMLPGKSYCFLVCATLQDSERIYLGMHNISTIGQQGAVTYLSYVKELPAHAGKSEWDRPLPSGLLVISDFVSE